MNNDIEEYKNKLIYEYELLIKNQWNFLNMGWSDIKLKRNHRSNIILVKNIKLIKETLHRKLGIIPVYFFLTILFESHDYRGPYNNIEKGLLMLYYLVENKSSDDMNEFIPKSSFYDIYREFYISKAEKLNKIVNYALEYMFSNIKIRILSALILNPQLFSHVTLYLDGHDTRGIEVGSKDKSIYYSYKLKKAGFRTQVAIDINNMITFVSESKPCRDHTDSIMFLDMNIEKKINNIDCIALDGGYNPAIKYLIDKTNLNHYNFSSPIRKRRNIELNHIESDYNLKFGGFRSKIEKIFADLGDTFKRFNNEKPIKTSKIETFNIQLKIACLLLNIKAFVKLGNIEEEPFHKYWYNLDNFDFPVEKEDNLSDYSDLLPTINEKISNANTIHILHKQFLDLNLTNNNSNEDIDMRNLEVGNTNETSSYEIEKILNHRGITVNNSYYLVKWKNYEDESNLWIHYNEFDTYECIEEYWNNK
jgi:hypothetical protein